MDNLDASLIRAAIALPLASVIAIAARRRHLLDPGGAVAAIVVGTVVVATGGWWAGLLLVAFFLTSSLLSRSDHDHSPRTWRQVLANGAPATLFAMLSFVLGSRPLLVASAAAIAAATADTWATEVGRRSGALPRSVTSLRRVPVGTSGAVSLPGTLASAAGALVIAILGAFVSPLAPQSLSFGMSSMALIAVAGSIGCLIDSLLGASFQAGYRCRTCGDRVEDHTDHVADHELALESGVPWLTNDLVNFVAPVFAGLVAAFFAW